MKKLFFDKEAQACRTLAVKLDLPEERGVLLRIAATYDELKRDENSSRTSSK